MNKLVFDVAMTESKGFDDVLHELGEEGVVVVNGVEDVGVEPFGFIETVRGAFTHEVEFEAFEDGVGVDADGFENVNFVCGDTDCGGRGEE